MKDLYERNIFGPLGIKNTQFPVDQDIQSLVLHASFTMDRRFLHRRTDCTAPGSWG